MRLVPKLPCPPVLRAGNLELRPIESRSSENVPLVSSGENDVILLVSAEWLDGGGVTSDVTEECSGIVELDLVVAGELFSGTSRLART